MHAATRYCDLLLFAVYDNISPLNKKPVIRGQALSFILLFGLVLDRHPRREHFGERLLRTRVFGGVGLLTGPHAFFTANAFTDVQKRSELDA
jgi:hypothetical protein